MLRTLLDISLVYISVNYLRRMSDLLTYINTSFDKLNLSIIEATGQEIVGIPVRISLHPLADPCTLSPHMQGFPDLIFRLGKVRSQI